MRPFWIMGAASLWMATLGNLALWQELQKMGLMNQPQGWLLAAGLAGITAGATGALLGLLAWRWTSTQLSLITCSGFNPGALSSTSSKF